MIIYYRLTLPYKIGYDVHVCQSKLSLHLIEVQAVKATLGASICRLIKSQDHLWYHLKLNQCDCDLVFTTSDIFIRSCMIRSLLCFVC